MSDTTITRTIKIDGVLTDPTSVVLSDQTSTFGVRRTDTSATVVAADTAMTNLSVGVYSHTFTDPAPGLTYEYTVKFVFSGETYHIQGTVTGGVSSGTSVYDLLPEMAPFLKDCPTPIQQQQLRYAARDFLRKTELWKETLDAIDTIAGQDEYTLTTANNAFFHRVDAVRIEDVKVEYEFGVDDVLTLANEPAVAGDEIIPKVIFIPKEANTTYPAWLLERWGHAMVDGALFFLKSMTDKPWGDGNAANRQLLIYSEDVAEGRKEYAIERSVAVQFIEPRAFV